MFVWARYAVDMACRLYNDWATVNTGVYVLNTRNAINQFNEKFKGLPGDTRDLGKALKGCTGPEGSLCNPAAEWAGDGHIGRGIFDETGKLRLAPNTSVPATSPEDEPQLFWTQLALSGFGAGGTDAAKSLIDGTKLGFGVTNPGAPTNGGFIAGYIDTQMLPKEISPPQNPIAHNVLMLVSDEVMEEKAELSEKGRQPLSASQAQSLDLKNDDGMPLLGDIRGYGAPECFNYSEGKWSYNVSEPSGLFESASRDCGLIYLLIPHKQ